MSVFGRTLTPRPRGQRQTVWEENWIREVKREVSTTSLHQWPAFRPPFKTCYPQIPPATTRSLAATHNFTEPRSIGMNSLTRLKIGSRCRLRFRPQRYQFGFHRHAPGDSHVQHAFERPVRTRVNGLQPVQQIPQRVRVTNIFHGGLRANRGRAGENHDPMNRIDPGHQPDQRVIVDKRQARSADKVRLLAGPRFHAQDREVPLAGAVLQSAEYEVVRARYLA